MNLRILAELHPQEGLIFHVLGLGCRGVVLVDRSFWEVVPDPTFCVVTEAVTRALAEWYETDRNLYGGSNAEKVRRRLSRL